MRSTSFVRVPVARSTSARSAAARPMLRSIAYAGQLATYASVCRLRGVTCSERSLPSGTNEPSDLPRGQHVPAAIVGRVDLLPRHHVDVAACQTSTVAGSVLAWHPSLASALPGRVLRRLVVPQRDAEGHDDRLRLTTTAFWNATVRMPGEAAVCARLVDVADGLGGAHPGPGDDGMRRAFMPIVGCSTHHDKVVLCPCGRLPSRDVPRRGGVVAPGALRSRDSTGARRRPSSRRRRR